MSTQLDFICGPQIDTQHLNAMSIEDCYRWFQ